jgi:hypothetical protein
MTRTVPKPIAGGLLLGLGLLALGAHAFESGSTGADGAFNPTVNTVLALPPDGVFNFTDVNIPSGVTVSFQRNATNTPVVILASGNVTIAGTLHVNGGWSTPVGAAGDGNVGDDGLPGVGGPGGHAGGRGGQPGSGSDATGGNGLGPGGGVRGTVGTYRFGGGGGGFGTVGGTNNYAGAGGPTYGSEVLLPLIGGSGGGGGAGGSAFHGSGGGGGGGAILIAASGTVQVTGSILASGGASGAAAGAGAGGTGGGGSGGAIRIVATWIEGNGTIQATGGSAGAPSHWAQGGGSGGTGRIRLEAETITRTAATNPAYSFGEPTSVFIAGLPSLRIASVAGVAAPAAPTGHADIVLAADTPNTATVVFETTGVPVGNTVHLTVTPAYGAPVTVVSPALTGTTDSATASVAVDLPTGPSTLSAQTTYTVLASAGDELSMYAQGERVERVRLAATLGGASTITLITVSGREYTLPADRLPAMPVPAG